MAGFCNSACRLDLVLLGYVFLLPRPKARMPMVNEMTIRISAMGRSAFPVFGSTIAGNGVAGGTGVDGTDVKVGTGV